METVQVSTRGDCCSSWATAFSVSRELPTTSSVSTLPLMLQVEATVGPDWAMPRNSAKRCFRVPAISLKVGGEVRMDCTATSAEDRRELK